MFDKIDEIISTLRSKLNSKNIDEEEEFEIDDLKKDAAEEVEKLMTKIYPENEVEWEALGLRMKDLDNLPEPKNEWNDFEEENLRMMFPDEDDYND